MLKSELSKKIKRDNITSFPELGINYWGINKVATSTLVNHFVLLTGKHINVQVSSGQKGKSLSKTRAVSKEIAYTNGLINLGVVRHPEERFESCYRHFKFPKDDVQAVGGKKANFDPAWTADDFLDHIDRVFLAGRIGNKHYSKQTWYIPEPGRLDHIIKLERLTEDWPFVFPSPQFVSNPTTKVWNLKYNKEKLHEIYQCDFDTFGY